MLYVHRANSICLDLPPDICDWAGIAGMDHLPIWSDLKAGETAQVCEDDICYDIRVPGM